MTRTAVAHTYDNACDANCNTCNKARTPADHVYDNACDATCNVCNAERTVADHAWGEWAENEEGKFLTTKGVASFAPLLEPVSSYSYIEAWQNACQYYIPNSMDVQIKRMSLD